MQIPIRCMRTKLLSTGWEKLIDMKLPKIEINKGDASWVFELLGWKKNARIK